MITDCPVLFDQSQLIVLNKPAGLLSHPNSGRLTSSNRGAFWGAYDFETKVFSTDEGPIWLLHRLDQDTSGALLAARDEKTARLFREHFEQGKVDKTYLAVVRGDPGNKGIWTDHLALKRDGTKARSVILRGHPPNAELRFRRIVYLQTHRVSLVEIRLMTGKTHQIRVQFNSRQHPLLGDDLYGDFAWNKKSQRTWEMKRLALHAWQLEFPHPETRRRVRVRAPLPRDFAELLSALGIPARELLSHEA
ncbi:MAG: hypothetical protein RJB38_294 [Pseudomonadota bacterium]|jgi:RluA family pseudouridine synthase